MSMILAPGAILAATPWHAATKPSSRPKSVRKVRQLTEVTNGERTCPPRGSAYDGRREPSGGQVASLTELGMRVLAFERNWWRSPGAKEREILAVFGMSPTRYYQILSELIDNPAAAQADPVVVARLRRRRAARARLRSGRGTP